MDLNQKFNIAIQLNKAFNTRNEEKNIAVIKYSESTQTYYSDENLAKEHVKQITQKDINTAKTKVSLEDCMQQIKDHLEIEKSYQNKNKAKWRSTKK